ncbi:DUF3565 domain-containing protein [Microbulbifer thermotolerans]|uniref:DUF3565 domain-containing protein n=1 Tax=Microbulbifer thermotolerans TaxID=252514 RepID=A0A143HHV6_MICTH|nr:DUF3565 domain-containing protein [Microbulbifer thermotolerans]AMX01308.1 pressure-regulated protein [Microbulbifer thermotolerans]MCX2779106.1 DUF3565 domain-containing protein [Microbulbifer thermotolerans]MCX2782708.1 DUF3565 domain-containing protein [Microbulbifer thermotolerans]MCX2795638.1 DUF3565 domain-containing protein [Microbulbifer thermotolerans]MCX2800176.1 DUF3565 domain-containing protein [Microbulbifer thermotolerans]
MQQPICGYHRDEEDHWVAELTCGHNQHVRHDPPWQNRPWVTSRAGRDSMLGHLLNCKKCDEGAPRDWFDGARIEEGKDQ